MKQVNNVNKKCILWWIQEGGKRQQGDGCDWN